MQASTEQSTPRDSSALGKTEFIALAGVFATLLGVLVTWLVMRRQFASKKLSYSYSVERLLRNSEPDLSRDLQVTYRGDLLPSPTLLNLEIINTGPTAVENASVVVKLPDATYLIPGFFVDVPVGYEDLWEIERSDAEECTILLRHINPKQVARVRLLMDEVPDGELRISCAMPNVEFTRASPVKLGLVAKILVDTLAPPLIGLRLK